MIFDGFMQYVGGLISDKTISNYVFRGQSDISWGLLTSYARFYNRIKEDDVFSMNIYTSMLADFIRRMSEFYGKNFTDLPEFQKIALSQHYGIPSPFLDWSSSPYIALYFALIDSVDRGYTQSCKVSLHVLDVLNMSRGYEYNPALEPEIVTKKEIDFRFIRSNNFYSRRVVSQQGCFTYYNSRGDLMGYNNNKELGILKYDIEGSPIDMLKHLMMMGINGCNLYDDVDYIGKDIKVDVMIKIK